MNRPITARSKKFSSLEASEWAVGPIQPTGFWLSQTLFPETKRRGREADRSPLVPSLRMCGANFTSPHAFMACIGTALFYLCVKYNLRIFMDV